ncbi:hypothetical protein F4810DRAFT_432878 [Camillea tinctor]|nr:hypothetical protein F4810DRAFT_432878 [Camillea tinctor]
MQILEHATPKVSVDDIQSFSEAELIQYLEEHRRPDGNFNFQLEGWDDLPKAQRDSLAQRFRSAAQKAIDATQSRPVDAAELATRLVKISKAGKGVVSDQPEQPPRLPPAPPPSQEHELNPNLTPTAAAAEDENLRFERICHADLLSLGGRPPYPIALLPKVFRNPDEYRSMLRPWQHLPDGRSLDWNVYFKQLRRWQDFQRWQRTRRGIYDAEEEHFAHAAMRTSQMVRMREAELLLHIEQDPSRYFRSEWASLERTRARDSAFWAQQEGGAESFAGYAAAARARLAPANIHLHPSPALQDARTTWGEYLLYETLQQARHAAVLAHLRRRQARLSGETSYSVGEERRARDAVARAEDRVQELLADEGPRHRNPLYAVLEAQARTRRLGAAQRELSAAREVLGAVVRRREAGEACEAQERVLEGQGLLVRWVREQFALMEERESGEGVGGVEPPPQSPPRRIVTRGLLRRQEAAERSRLAVEKVSRAEGRRSDEGPSVEVKKDRVVRGRKGRQQQPPQKKVYEKTRASRRLAGLPPEFGTQAERWDTLGRRRATRRQVESY